MSKTDTVYVRELLELTGAKDLYEDLGVDARCSRTQLVAALERKRDWARQFPDDPVARWWTRHMVRTARLLVHDDSRPKRKRRDDLDAAIKGAVLQGAVGPEMRRLVVRMAERRGLDASEVDAMIDRERKALEDLQKKIQTALGTSPNPEAEAKEAIRAAMWGAMVAGNVSPAVVRKIVERGRALGLDVGSVRKVLDEVKAEWRTEREETLDTDVEGRWVPPHRRTVKDEALQRKLLEEDPKWTLADSLEDGLDEIVRNALEEQDGIELDLDTPLPEQIDTASEPFTNAERNPVTGASAVLSVRAIPIPVEPKLPPFPRGPKSAPELPPFKAVGPKSSPALPSFPRAPKSSDTLAPFEAEPPRTVPPAVTLRARALALHTMLSTVAVMGGALYGVTWFLLANRGHLF